MTKNGNTVSKTNDDFIMLPVVDFVFKLLFGDVSHKERLISLISAVLDKPKEEFADITIVNTELPKLFAEDKKGVLDIRVMLQDKKQVNIEIQVLPLEFMPERTLYYWAKMYTSQLKEGYRYTELKKCITINIVDYEFLPEKRMHTKYHLIEDRSGNCLTDVIEVHFCELKKLRSGEEIIDADDPAVEWMRFLAARTKGEMEVVAKNNEEIKETLSYLEIISKDEQNRLAYEAQQMWLMDQRTREATAKAKEEDMTAREEAAKAREKFSIARNLLSIGVNVADIAKVMGLTIDEIEKLE